MDQGLIDDIISTSFGGAAAGLALYGMQVLFTWIGVKRDARRVHAWMTKERVAGGDKYRSTRAIASHNNLTEDRARFVCSRDERIKLSVGDDPDKWSLEGRGRKSGF
ncbi:hypothetical protein [Pseudomonas fluorescens]|uniref:Uncharacterized protein n=1 Tax=Pseudomonas fluorescens TaxID=294 RepID=A0A5E7E543_PSEFL|nr:hypothetical protein [Pseudomonas fluorescens]VVO21790.1 hypothetical protein PS723_04269 [Pseudomonas fluorescens]